jgi:pilus assembly protein CpaF
MLQAMNTGHDGSMTTLHANKPRDALARLETMVLMAGVDLPLKAIRQQVASAIDIIVQISRLRDGSRRITDIVELVGMEEDTITLQDIFKLKILGAEEDGEVASATLPTGMRPRILERLFEQSLQVPPEIKESSPTRSTRRRCGEESGRHGRRRPISQRLGGVMDDG